MAYKELVPPQMPGISDPRQNKLGFGSLGKKLFDLVGLNINPLSPEFGSAGKGVPGATSIGITDKWELGLWHDMPNPFKSKRYEHEFSVPQEPVAEFGLQLSRSF